MASQNKVFLIGRLTKDPELRKTTQGISYCRFCVACERRAGKDEQKASDFLSCVAWRQNADYISGYGLKGSLVSVEGFIQTGSYKDRDGRTVYTTDICVDRVQLLESKKASGSSNYQSYGKSLRKEDVDANDGFDVGGNPDGIPDEDLPF